MGLLLTLLNLNEIRQERLKSLGLNNNANYASIERINYELEYSKKIMEKLNCVVIDVSNKAVEETAGIIIEHMKKNFGDECIIEVLLYATLLFNLVYNNIDKKFKNLKDYRNLCCIYIYNILFYLNGVYNNEYKS